MFNPFYALIGFCLEKIGLERWWMTHGIGSVGSVAKSMAKAYNRAKVAYPTASQDEILFITLKSRYTVFEIKNLTEDDMVDMVKDSGGRLAELSLQVVMLENPAARNALLFHPQIYAMMVEVIEEVTAKFAVET
jgi:NADPH:quinone reductase-like Zn-dependent oxidoreductase